MRDHVKLVVVAAVAGFLGAATAIGGAVAGEVLKFPQANGTNLWVGNATIADGHFLKRSGSNIVGQAGGGGGESTTASNVGTAGVGVFKQLNGVDLEFKKVNAGSAKVTITDDTGNNEVDVDVVTGTSASSVCVGNDSRLSDARTPLSHTHGLADVTDEGALASLSTVGTSQIDTDAVTYAKIQNVSATDKVLGRSTAGAGDVEEIACTAAGRALIDDADAAAQRTTLGAAASGDVTSSGLTMATARLLGRTTASTGAIEEITVGSGLSLSGGSLTAAVPAWWGDIYGAQGDCDPAHLMEAVQTHGANAATPTNISTSVARCAFFRPPADITVDRIRFYGVGSTTGIYRVAIYRYSDLARLAVVNDFNTPANSWSSAGSNLNLSLTAGTLYFIAVAVDSTGTTPGIACMGASLTAPTGQIQSAPGSLPGNLDADAGFLDGYQFQFAVTTGALPDPAATLAAQGAWTGGMPAFWLDANDS